MYDTFGPTKFSWGTEFIEAASAHAGTLRRDERLSARRLPLHVGTRPSAHPRREPGPDVRRRLRRVAGTVDRGARRPRDEGEREFHVRVKTRPIALPSSAAGRGQRRHAGLRRPPADDRGGDLRCFPEKVSELGDRCGLPRPRGSGFEQDDP